MNWPIASILSNRDQFVSTLNWRKVAAEVRLFLLVLSGALPAWLLLVWLSITSALPLVAKAVIVAVSLAWIVVVALAVLNGVLHHIRTLINLLESTQKQDYSFKSGRANEPGELAELYHEINSLTDSLKVSHQSEQELLNILEKVVSQINVAIFVFDARDRIRLVNQLAGALLKSTSDNLIGVDRADTVLAQLPVSSESKLVDFRFPGADGRWQVRQHYYRHQGQASRILFIADLKQVLSDEEITAWQRLIRVISHEVNNSLTPITSLCQTLAGILRKSSAGSDPDVREGLTVIAERARGLQDFISAYARLARLPEPHMTLFTAAELIQRLQRIFAGHKLEIVGPGTATMYGDPVQLEQALINLIKNGLEANPVGAPPVQLTCEMIGGQVEFQVADHGAGIGNPENLFVPFYTTKAQGAGIGLILCRQIAAKHHGHVRLENRADGPGAVSRLNLPLPPLAAAAVAVAVAVAVGQ